MKKFLSLLTEIHRDVEGELYYFFASNLRYIAAAIDIAIPYLMYYIGQDMAVVRGYKAVGGEIFIPILLIIASYYIRQIANRTGKGNTVPVPAIRFTEVDRDTGEVTVVMSRMEEMLLYMADLEDWLQRKQMLK